MSRLLGEDATKYRFAGLGKDQSEPREAMFCSRRLISRDIYVMVLDGMASYMNPSLHLYHTAPLHYLPHILQSGALYAKSITAGQGIKPRHSAVRRDKMLGLTDWVHLSTRPDTPLLRDKLAQGYPHVLLYFDREAVLALPEVALLPYNTKAWQTRAAYVPVTEAAEKAEMLRRHDEEHHLPSLEVLVHYGLDFAHLTRIGFAADDECVWATELLRALGLQASVPLAADPMLAALYQPGGTRLLTRDYFAACVAAHCVLPPPDIVFD